MDSRSIADAVRMLFIATKPNPMLFRLESGELDVLEYQATLNWWLIYVTAIWATLAHLNHKTCSRYCRRRCCTLEHIIPVHKEEFKTLTEDQWLSRRVSVINIITMAEWFSSTKMREVLKQAKDICMAVIKGEDHDQFLDFISIDSEAISDVSSVAESSGTQSTDNNGEEELTPIAKRIKLGESEETAEQGTVRVTTDLELGPNVAGFSTLPTIVDVIPTTSLDVPTHPKQWEGYRGRKRPIYTVIEFDDGPNSIAFGVLEMGKGMSINIPDWQASEKLLLSWYLRNIMEMLPEARQRVSLFTMQSQRKQIAMTNRCKACKTCLDEQLQAWLVHQNFRKRRDSHSCIELQPAMQ